MDGEDDGDESLEVHGIGAVPGGGLRDLRRRWSCYRGKR